MSSSPENQSRIFSFSLTKKGRYCLSQVLFCPDNVGCYEDFFITISTFCFFLITCAFLCTFLVMLCTGRYLHPLLKIFSWIILSLSLHHNKTVWHVWVNKMVVSLIISDTTVCASLYFWLHYKPDMISHLFPLFLSSFSQYLEK